MSKKEIAALIAASIVCIGLFLGLFSISKTVFGDKEQIPDRIVTNDTEGDESNVTPEEDTVTPLPVPDTSDTPTVVEPIEKTVSFLAAGDNIIHQAVMDDAKRVASEKGLGDTYSFEHMYDDLKSLIADADISFINQEGPIAGKSMGYSGWPNFNAPDEAGITLVNLGFDIVNIANNHLLDRGEKGYANSIEFWKKQPITLIGGYESEDDFNTIRYYEYNDLTIALLSYTYGTNGYYLPSTSTMWVPYYNENDVVNKHSKEARENADIVIASMHWGDENIFAPNDIQKKYCDILVKNNVDVIIGTHPHVLQPVEWKDRPDGKKTLVAYSIGNLLSTMEKSQNMVGGLLSFEIKYTEPENAEIVNPRIIPTMCYYSKKRDSLKLYKFSDFSEELYLTHGCTLKENVNYKTVIGYVTNTIDRQFLDEEFLESIG